MKYALGLCSALVLFCSAAALAIPAVGDDATYNMTLVAASETVTATWERQLTQESSDGTQFLEQDTLTVSGQPPQVQQTWVNTTDLPSDTALSSLFQKCTQWSGTVQPLTTPAGDFQTCEIPADGGTGTYWLGQVPWGTIQMTGQAQDGSQIILTLTSVTEGSQSQMLLSRHQ